MSFDTKVKRLRDEGRLTCQVWKGNPCWDCLRELGVTPRPVDRGRYGIFPHGVKGESR